ncbi:MAG: alpha/beta hydrolase [Henriciella sp.]|nr:alpha/beta hydrolase [Henriciella sp.]
METTRLIRDRLALTVDDTALDLAVMRREGRKAPILFLHGFGSTKEDYGDLAFHPRFAGRPLIGYDAPGFGQSHCDDLSVLSIPFLVETAKAMVAHYQLDQFHLVGHSMGGLTALKLAEALGHHVISFTNIEGNVAPEDCFLSRQIVDHPKSTPEAFLTAFAERAYNSHGVSHPLYASTLAYKVRAGAVAPIFKSMVEISDSDPLFETFCTLPCAKMFVYGDENRHLSYLGALQDRGVQVAEIEHSGHFPMYANPPALWARMAVFVELSERDGWA